MLLPAPQHIWYRPAYDMAVQGAVLQCLNRPHTWTHSGQWNCFGLPMVVGLMWEDRRTGNLQKMCNEHIRCESWLTTSANCMLPDMTSCTDFEMLTHLWYDSVYWLCCIKAYTCTLHSSFACTSHTNGVSAHLWCTPSALALIPLVIERWQHLQKCSGCTWGLSVRVLIEKASCRSAANALHS